MNIMELGAIGELVGGMAVIGSLIYVGLQLQQTRKVLVSNAHRDWVRDNTAAIHFAAADEAAAKIWLDGLRDYRGLSPTDSWRFDVTFVAWLTNVEGAFQDRVQGLGRFEAATVHEATLKQMLATPGGREWWTDRRGWFSQSFQQWVDTILGDDSIAANPPLSGVSA